MSRIWRYGLPILTPRGWCILAGVGLALGIFIGAVVANDCLVLRGLK